MTETKHRGNCEEQGLSNLVRRLIPLVDASDKVTVHAIREQIGDRSFGPFMIIPALIEISPIGGIPGVPTVIAMIIAVFALQVLFGRQHLWLPKTLERRVLDGGKLKRSLQKLTPMARYADMVVRPRLRWATAPPCLQLLAILVILLCAAVPPLELIPFASTVPMLAVVMVGLALLVRDGLASLISVVLSIASGYLVYTSLTV